MDGEKPYLIAAAITVSGGAVLWFASRLYEVAAAWSSARGEKEKFVRALYAEIDFNTFDLEAFVSVSPSMSTLSAAIEANPDLIPHVTDARHTHIYMSKVNLIHFVGNRYIGDVVLFYGNLEKIKSQIDGLALPSYKTISPKGRANVISSIFNDARRGAFIGRDLLSKMELVYPDYNLARQKRTAPEYSSDADIKSRKEKFDSDLDRIRSAHDVSPR